MMLAEHLDISVAEACHHFGTAITERNAEDAYAQKSDGTLCVAGLAQALTSSFVKVRAFCWNHESDSQLSACSSVIGDR